MKDEPLYRDAVFAPDQVSDYQVHHHRYSPDSAAFETVCHQTYSMLSSTKSDFQSQVSGELFRVYVAELLWLRWGQVLRSQGDHIPELMREALDRASEAPIMVPEPIYLWLMSYGEILASTGERILMSAPQLPTVDVDGHHGFWGPVALANHNLYEALPALGLCHERVRHTLAPGAAPAYVSVLGAALNANAIGFGEAPRPRPAVATRLLDIGYTAANDPEDTNQFGLSFSVLRRVSEALEKTEVFRLQHVIIGETPKSGSSCQFVITAPVDPAGMPVGARPIAGSLITASFQHNTSATLGAAVVFQSQRRKEPTGGGPVPGAQNNAWCCLTTDPAAAAPQVDQAWVDSRNDRLNVLPVVFRERRFASAPREYRSFVRSVLTQMRRSSG